MKISLRPKTPPCLLALLLAGPVLTAPLEAQKKERPEPVPDTPSVLRPVTKSLAPMAVSRPVLVPEHLDGQDLRIPIREVFQMEVPEEVDAGPMVLQVPFQGELFTLQLRKHSSRAAGFQVLEHRADGSYHDVTPAEIRTLRGTILEDKGAVVAGSLLDSGLEARITLGDGRVIEIEPHLPSFRAGIRNNFIAFDPRDIPFEHQQQHQCQPQEAQGYQTNTTSAAQGGGCGAAMCRAELALDLDLEFYRDYDSDYFLAADMAENIINHTNVVYERDLGLTHVITTIIIRTSAASEPPAYADAGTAGMMRLAFKDHWNSAHTGIQRDLAHLLSGRFIGGQATTLSGGGPVVCDTSLAYAVSGRFGDNLRETSTTVMHEIAHNFGADHCSCSDPAYIMNPDLLPTSRFNPTETVPELISYSASLSCLEPTSPNDSYEDALAICDGDRMYLNTGAATHDAPSDPGCGLAANSPDLWLSYTPATSGTATVSTVNTLTDYDTVLAVYEDSFFSPSLLACNDDFGSLQSEISWSVAEGRRYLICVSGYNGDSGTAEVDLSGPQCELPFNDDWRNPLLVGPGFYYGTTSNATNGGDVPFACGMSSLSPDVWFLYEPLGTSDVQIDLGGSSYDTVLSVYSPTEDSIGEEIACNDDALGLTSYLQLTPSSPDERFLIRVSGFNGAKGAFRLGISGPDSQNSFCFASNSLTTGEHFVALEGAHVTGDYDACSSEQPDLWFRWTAEYPGELRVSTCGTRDWNGLGAGVDTVVSLYSGCPNVGGWVLDCSDDSYGLCEPGASTFDSFVTTEVDELEQIYIRVSRATSAPGRKPIKLKVDFAITNDDCSSATPVDLGEYSGTLVGATPDGDASCGNSAASPDVWYRYVSPGCRRLEVTTCGTNDIGGTDQGIDTVLSLHDGPCGPVLDCSDDTGQCGNLDAGQQRDSGCFADLEAGQEVWIRVSTYGGGAGGPFKLTLQDGQIVGNDECVDAATIFNGNWLGTLDCATSSAGATCNGFEFDRPDIWYRYTATCDGLLEVNTCGTHDYLGVDQGVDTILSLHDSSCSGEITCNDDAGGACEGWDEGILRDSFVQLPVTTGQEIFIRVQSFYEETGPFILRISCTESGPSAYCSPTSGNSISPDGAILSSVEDYGTASATFQLENVPLQPGLLYAGPNQVDLPFGCGRRCVGGQTVRGAPFIPDSTTVSGIPFDMGATGLTHIQYWYRDPQNAAACGSGFNLSSALMP